MRVRLRVAAEPAFDLAGIEQRAATRDRPLSRPGPRKRFQGKPMEQLGKPAIDPVVLERMHEPHAELRAVVGVVAPCVRREQVFALEVEARKRLCLRWSEELGVGCFGELDVETQVPIADSARIA
jgi:hypothetical protein